MTVANNITSGTIAIEDGTKAKEEFAPARKVKVELSFSVPEGQDGAAYMQGVARIAETKVQEMLGRVAAKVVAAAADPKPVEVAKTEVETPAQKKKREAAEAKAAAAAAPKEKTKADLAREAGLPAGDDELLEDEPTITAAGKVVADEDDLTDLLGDAPLVVVTDKQLGEAAQRKNGTAKAADPNWAPVKIRELIAKFSTDKTINNIPAEKREQFLKELDALK